MKNNGWESYRCLKIVEKMNRFALLNYKIFCGNAPDPHTGEGLRHPSQNPPLGTPALRAT